MASTFLVARWQHLLMANYAVDPVVLADDLPFGNEIDFFKGKTYLSLVGFMFLDTKVKGIKIPFHVNFPEVNLRFYVKRGDKRGVVFIKELVPRLAIATIANLIYKENYQALPMENEYEELGDTIKAGYRWRHKGQWNHMRAEAAATAVEIGAGSEEEFITEHYWGYARASATRTTEYEVQHPRWQHHPVSSFDIQVDWGAIYGERFAPFLKVEPTSVLLANGSAVKVLAGEKIEA